MAFSPVLLSAQMPAMEVRPPRLLHLSKKIVAAVHAQHPLNVVQSFLQLRRAIAGIATGTVLLAGLSIAMVHLTHNPRMIVPISHAASQPSQTITVRTVNGITSLDAKTEDGVQYQVVSQTKGPTTQPAGAEYGLHVETRP